MAPVVGALKIHRRSLPENESGANPVKKGQKGVTPKSVTCLSMSLSVLCRERWKGWWFIIFLAVNKVKLDIFLFFFWFIFFLFKKKMFSLLLSFLTKFKYILIYKFRSYWTHSYGVPPCKL